MSHREWNMDAKVYIGSLSEGASKVDVEDAFSRYGRLRNVWVARNPPGFAFVEYEDPRDAEDAVRGLDGCKIAGSRVKVEMSHGRSRRPGPPRSRDSKYTPPRRDHNNRGSRRDSRDRSPPPKYRDRRDSSPPPRYREPIPRRSRSRSRSIPRRSRSRSRSRSRTPPN